jgi:hypothetical protein
MLACARLQECSLTGEALDLSYYRPTDLLIARVFERQDRRAPKRKRVGGAVDLPSCYQTLAAPGAPLRERKQRGGGPNCCYLCDTNACAGGSVPRHDRTSSGQELTVVMTSGCT